MTGGWQAQRDQAGDLLARGFYKPQIVRSRNGWNLRWDGKWQPYPSWQDAVNTLVRLDTAQRRIPPRVHTPECDSRKGAAVSCNCWVAE